MQRHRVGGGQARARARSIGDKTERAEAGALGTRRRPELTGELGDRCLTVGTGDRDDERRLRAIEFGGHAGQTVTGVAIGNAANALDGNRVIPARGQYRHRAARHGFRDEPAPVGGAAWQGRKQKTRANRPAVTRNTLDIQVERPRRGQLTQGRVTGGAIAVDELRKTQGVFDLSLVVIGYPELVEFPATPRQKDEFRAAARFGR